MKMRAIKIRRFANFARNESGGTLAELAILVPILVIMVAAISEFGRYFQTYSTLAKSTRSAARYLSNHPRTPATDDAVKSLVVCGKLTTCAANERYVATLEESNVCIETAGAGPIETVTVRLPRATGDCGAPVFYKPIFDIGALLHNSLTMKLPISPSVTMRYISAA